MEQKDMQVFDFEDNKQTRIVMKDGVPWWVGKDVCDILGYANHHKAIADHCKKKGVTKCYTPGGSQEMVIIPESDVYRLIIRSNMPEAERFETWIMEEVLPSIRKHGAYMMPQKADEITNTLIEALRKEQERVRVLENYIKENEQTIASGAKIQNAMNGHELVIVGRFAKVEREGNVLIGVIESSDDVVRGIIGFKTLMTLKEDGTYYFDYAQRKTIHTSAV